MEFDVGGDEEDELSRPLVRNSVVSDVEANGRSVGDQNVRDYGHAACHSGSAQQRHRRHLGGDWINVYHSGITVIVTWDTLYITRILCQTMGCWSLRKKRCATALTQESGTAW